MALFKKMAKVILGLDDTETSNQEVFIKDLYKQNTSIRAIETYHKDAFLESLLEKHDLISFALIQNKQILVTKDNFKKTEIKKLISFFDFVKNSLDEKVVMLHGSPWVTMFKKEDYLFITKKEIKLNEMEINAITHDVLNAESVFEKQNVKEKISEKIVYTRPKRAVVKK